MKKIINLSLIFFILVFVIFSLFSFIGYFHLEFFFYMGRFFVILFVSIVLSFLLSYVMLNLYFFTYLKIIKPLVNSIFILPQHIYVIILLTIISINMKNIVLVFGIVNSLLLLKKYIDKIEELNKKDFINYLKLLDAGPFTLFFKHIFPLFKNVLIISIIDAILFVFDMFLILYFLGFLDIFSIHTQINYSVNFLYSIYFLSTYMVIKYISFENINRAYI